MAATAAGLLLQCLCVVMVRGFDLEEDSLSLLQEVAKLHDHSPRPETIETSAYFWAGKNGDLSRTGASTFPRLPVNLSAGPAWSWHEQGDGLVRAAPLIDGQRNIYLATISGGIYKFNAEGALLWTHRATASIPEVPSILNGLLYATGTNAEVVALDMETGREQWRQKIGRCSAGDTWSMTAGEGVVVAAASLGLGCDHNQQMVALDAKTGSILWRFFPDDVVYNVLASIHEGSLVFADSMGKAYRLELATGRLIWKLERGHEENQQKGFSTGGAIVGPDGVIYVTSNAKDGPGGPQKGYITAYSFADGAKLWRHGTEYEANNAAAAGHLTPGGPLAIVVGVGQNPDLPDRVMQLFHVPPTNPKPGRILAVNAATGAELWRHDMPLWHGWAAGDREGHICLPDSFGNPAIGGDGTVFVGFEDGLFYGVRDSNEDGRIDPSEVSTYNTGNAFQGSPGLAPGMVVATPCNGMHVFKTPGM